MSADTKPAASTLKAGQNFEQYSLKQLQTQMLAWLQVHDKAIKASVTGTDKVSADLRLDIYANAYRYRLIEALEDNFPAVNTLLGDEDFFKLGLKYVDACPSQHFSLRYFGQKLANFLTTAPDYGEQKVVAEMAQFEWLLREAFDAASEPRLTLESLQTIVPEQWPTLQFKFHPSVQRINLVFNVPQLWQAIDQDQPPIDIIEQEYPVGWFIWRKELRTWYRSMDVDEAWAMDAMIEGENFTTICAGVCEWIDEQHAAVRVAGFIQNWINEGLLCGIRNS